MTEHPAAAALVKKRLNETGEDGNSNTGSLPDDCEAYYQLAAGR